MFSPTKFPCTAFVVTPSLNVRECTVERRNSMYSDLFHSSAGVKYGEQLFGSRTLAVAEAERLLKKMHERYVAAGVRWTKCAANVAKLKKGGA